MGRPKADISADKVREFIQRGFKIVEIAEYFGVHRSVIHDRFPTEITKGRFGLKDQVRRAQLRAAEMGNSAMLVWLGKVYLGQSDTTIDEYLIEAIEKAGLSKEDLLELIKSKDELTITRVKRSFHEFCKVAGYPPPFDKQVEMMEFGFHEKATRLLLGARGIGKTDYITILGTAYDLYMRPESSTNLIITKSKERNAAMLREIQAACIKNGVIFDRANATHLRAKGLHGKDHSVSAVTIKTVTLRGRHPERVLMDDPVTEDDTSAATRLHVERVYNEVMKLTQTVLIVGQPAHQHDLYAKLRGIVKTMEVPHGMIPELDHDLEAQRVAGVDEASISASYHLKVLTEGTAPFDKIRMLDAFPMGSPAVAFLDPADTGKDHTAITILKAHMQGVAVVGFTWRKAWNHCLDDCQLLFRKYGVARLCFEVNMTGNQPIEMLRQAFPGVGVVGHRANTHKHSRIMAAGSYAHLIHLAKESGKSYRDQVIKYEYGAEPDDAPDSLASCLQWIGLIRGKE